MFGPSQEVIDAQVSQALRRAAAPGTQPQERGADHVAEALQRATAPAPPAPPAREDGGISWSRIGGFMGQIAGATAGESVAGLLGIEIKGTRQSKQETAADRKVAQEDRDATLQRLIEEENERRTAIGEEPLSYRNDPEKLRELRDQADTESGYTPRIRTLDEREEQDERAEKEAVAIEAANRRSEAGRGGETAALLALATTREPEREEGGRDERPSPTTGEGLLDRGPESPEDRNPSESGRAEITPEDIDLEALSRRLWEYMRSHLRTELLVDRERSGRLSDFH